MEVIMSHSLFELFTVMGPFAKGIVAILVAMSCASVATAIERMLALRAAARSRDRFLPGWRAVLVAPISEEARREAYDRTIRSALVATGSSLRRGLGIIAAVGATAPFVGLVGTVLGIVNAFQQLAAGDQGGVGQVSAGIAEALVTTALGIAVAIPAVWLFNYLSQRIASFLADLEVRAQELAVATLTEAR
jgi:biopolymer transport protein ExbB/TolQ